ncbi:MULTISPECIES: ABC transporter permease [Arcicella]|uniref:ABC transporter permease n=1 Tax=Arcicella lustrica TaxID=2984196 RepID=A0ABU5SMD0_9BACT|nr:ABC transporter permease [Arcicella sp. DC25W]MEA5428456.1 ABC transporter permease [Arcicella sp. DC25W]
MNLLENIREGLRSIKANMLRTTLTALIIAIGVTALVGSLTVIDGIQSSVNNSFAGLGANAFDLRNRDIFKIRKDGEKEKNYPQIDYREAKMYKEKFGHSAIIGLKVNVSFSVEVKYESKKTNPNSRVMGTDDNFMDIKGYKISKGRTFSANDLQYAVNVCIIGVDIVDQLFGKNINPIDKEINILGQKFKVIGLLEKKGSLMGGGDDRVIFMPLETGRKMAQGKTLTFDIVTSVPNITDIDNVIEEARGVMRIIRQDQIGEPDSFSIERSDSLAKQSESITGILRVAGFGVGFITLLGAAIALMNIMLVSVTERTQEIGIRKSLGATPYLIRLQFLIEAVVICILGGLGGIFLAILIGNLFAQLLMGGTASFIMPWFWMSIGIGVCVVVGLFSGIYPAYKASKLDPIESLRYE